METPEQKIKRIQMEDAEFAENGKFSPDPPGKFNPAHYFTAINPVYHNAKTRAEWIELKEPESAKKRAYPLHGSQYIYANIIPYRLGATEPEQIPGFLLNAHNGTARIIVPAWQENMPLAAHDIRVPEHVITERLQPFAEIDKVLIQHYKLLMRDSRKPKKKEPERNRPYEGNWRPEDIEKTNEIARLIHERQIAEFVKRGVPLPKRLTEPPKQYATDDTEDDKTGQEPEPGKENA